MSLYVVSIPIGHPDDITLRAIETLKNADILICEEYKEGRKLIKRLNIDKELYNLNEHNEEDEVDELIQLLLKGKTAAIFSDCGTPLFADPGTRLVNRCHEAGIRVIPIPGPSSLLAALSVAGVEINQFYYAGFLSRKPEDRRHEIEKLTRFHCPVVIYDTPYRLKALLSDLKRDIPSAQQIVLLLSLTKPDERIVRGSVSEVLTQLNNASQKKEFVLILRPFFQNSKKSNKHVKKYKKQIRF
ncbi:16S rRNA (cytidine(1402)-2'-O)-methyltransferase [bacterium]|nr:16S rRNA (cytidine(1402)-2'-O)-methyltransferase [bacterium]